MICNDIIESFRKMQVNRVLRAILYTNILRYLKLICFFLLTKVKVIVYSFFKGCIRFFVKTKEVYLDFN